MALCTRAASTVARPRRNGEGPTHLGLRVRTGDSIPPPFTSAAPPFDSGRPAVTRRTRCYRGESSDQGEPMGGGRAEGGSPQRSSGGEGIRR
jgi:hypothetical protein